jgi:integrase
MLTEVKCRAAKPGTKPDGSPKRVLLHDKGGLYLQVDKGKDGVTTSWLYRYSIVGKNRQIGLGSYPKVSLADARNAAAVQRAIRASGRDPLLVKQDARAELVAKIQAEAAPKPKTMTFDQCAKVYIDTHKAGWKNAKSETSWRSTLRTYAAPVIGSKDVVDVTTADVLEILRSIWLERHSTAANVRSRIELVLDWATAHGHRPDSNNPASWRRLKHLLPDASKVAKVEHHAALSYKDIAAFMADVAAVEGVQARALQFCILTATRTDETRRARWREIDLDERVWTIPDERMKADEEHTVPLSNTAMRIIMSLRTEETEPDHYIFAQPTGRPFCESGMLTLAKKLRPDTKLTVHGFRSCFRDWCGDETDTPREIAESALAHKIGGVEGAYRRGTALQKRRTLMELWSSHCASGTVVPFKRSA